MSHDMRQMQKGGECEVNIQKLKGMIVEKNMNVEGLAERVDTSAATLYRLLQNPEKIKIGMALKIKVALEMSDQEAIDIFLT